MTNYCVFCNFDSECAFIVCENCSIIAEVPQTFVPATCDDEFCFVTANGELNFDGLCDHEAEFSVYADRVFGE